jgi:hypothetical protein
MVKLYLFLLAFAATLATNFAFTLTVPTKLGSSTTFSAPIKTDSSTALSYYGTIAPYRSGYGYGTSYYDRPYWNRYEADGAYDMYGDYYSGGYYNRRMSPYRNDYYGYGRGYGYGYGRGYGYGMDRYGYGRGYYHDGYDSSGRYPNERPSRYYGYGRYGRYGYGGASIRDLERRLDRAEARAYGGYGRWGRRSYYDGYGYGGNYRNTYSYADGYNRYGRDRYYDRYYGGYGRNNYYNRYYGGYGMNDYYGRGYGSYYNRYGRYY